MKSLCLILLSLAVFAAKTSAQSNSDTLRKHVVRISTLPYGRSAARPETLHDAATYILSHFRIHSSKTVVQAFSIHKTRYENLICSFGPDSAPRLIVGANYDVYEHSPGADNNASGVAALLELSKLLSKVNKSLVYRIDLVAYSPSEPPFLNTNETGSHHHAKSLLDQGVTVLGMINIKCIGYFSNQKKSQRYPFLSQNLIYTHRGNFISMLSSPGSGSFANRMKYQLKLYANGLSFRHFKPAIPFPVLKDGDHKSYSDLGIPSLIISNTMSFRNKYFRYDVDTYSTLDYIRMSKTVNMIYMALIRYRR